MSVHRYGLAGRDPSLKHPNLIVLKGEAMKLGCSSESVSVVKHEPFWLSASRLRSG